MRAPRGGARLPAGRTGLASPLKISQIPPPKRTGLKHTGDDGLLYIIHDGIAHGADLPRIIECLHHVREDEIQTKDRCLPWFVTASVNPDPENRRRDAGDWEGTIEIRIAFSKNGRLRWLDDYYNEVTYVKGELQFCPNCGEDPCGPWYYS